MARLGSAQMMSLLLGLGSSLFILAWLFARRRGETAEGFTTAGRQVGLGFGSASLLAGWIWALSLYAPAQAGYQYGLAGPLYYSLGGAMMLVVFSPFVRRMRALVPEGHTIPEYVGARCGQPARLLTVVIMLAWTFAMLYFNLSVVGYMVARFSPLSFETGVGVVITFTVAYSLLAGLKASILTDCVQFLAITVAGLVIAPLVVHRFGGPSELAARLPELGAKGQLLSSEAFLRMGLPWLLLGFVGGFSYQSVWQKAWAIDGRHVGRAYLLAGASWFPYSMAFGVFGVLALAAGIASPAGNGSDITPVVAAHYLHPAEAALFVMLILGAACSTCDSALCAFATILMTDIIRGHFAPRLPDRALVTWGRAGMVFAGVVGALLTFQRESLLDLLFLLGSLRASLVVPLLGSLFVARVDGKGYFWGVVAGMLVGMGSAWGLRPLTPLHPLLSFLAGLGASAAACLWFAWRNQHPFDFAVLSAKVRSFDA